jgi:hypothetical protein
MVRKLLSASLFLITMSLSGHLRAVAQSAINAPANVKIRVAPAAEIEAAETALLKAFAAGHLPGDWLNDGTTYGPGIWQVISLRMDPKLIAKAAPITGFVGGDRAFQVDFRAPRTPEQAKEFWKLLLETYPALKTAKPRPATAIEIKFYWGLIPFDIDEPLFALDAGKDVFIVNMPKIKNKTNFFWIDRVIPYSELRRATPNPALSQSPSQTAPSQ